MGTLDDYAIPSKLYRDAYFSRESDAPENPREYAGLVYHLKSGEALDEWGGEPTKSIANSKMKTKTEGASQRYWLNVGGYEYASSPPSHREARKWLATDADKNSLDKKTSNSGSQVGAS